MKEIGNVDVSGNADVEDITTSTFLCGIDTQQAFYHDEGIVVAGNDIATTYVAGQRYKFTAKQNTSADSDSFKYPISLRPGVYAFTFFGAKTPSSGIIGWYIDSTPIILGQDWYADPAEYNKYVYATITWSESREGYLIGLVNGQNGSSSGYDINLTKLWFRKTD